MTDGPGRLFGVLCVLAGVWIATYWLWEPSRPRTTIDRTKPVNVPGLDQIPITPPPVEPVAPPPRDPTPKTNGADAAPPRLVTRIEPPEYREYVVEQGDTWPRIARKFFGDSSKATLLTRHNPLVSPDLLRPGTAIRIPVDPDNLQGREVQVPDPVPESPKASETPPIEPTKPAGQTYVIQRDDTLWNVAKRFYGKGSMWKVIAEANADRIPDPHNPTAGVEIVIPAQP